MEFHIGIRPLCSSLLYKDLAHACFAEAMQLFRLQAQISCGVLPRCLLELSSGQAQPFRFGPISNKAPRVDCTGRPWVGC